jgi:protoporphyrinogen IX oxidase
MTFVLDHYQWFKAAHIIAVISWMAAMLYLPRLFVYHVDAPIGSALSETLKIMERRLAKFIMTPAMLASWVIGLLMLGANHEALMAQGWIHAKLTLLLLLTALHGVFSKWRKGFERDQNTRSARFYRIWNEGPTLLMIVIVVLAVVKPF